MENDHLEGSIRLMPNECSDNSWIFFTEKGFSEGSKKAAFIC